METLSVIAEGYRLGYVAYKKGKLSFRYDTAWLDDKSSYPLSTSMPLAGVTYSHDLVDAFLWGLLPDNRLVLESIAKSYQVSANNAFKLIKSIGIDCAGAIQFVPLEDEAPLLNPQFEEEVEWLSEEELAQHIQDVIQREGAGLPSNSEGQFSLAGAQLKTALYQRPGSDKWGKALGSTPTTHILKPAPKDYPGFAENEHFCLQLARALGMETADSYVEVLGGIPVIVVKRYDRFFDEDCYVRIHQEDFCQALGVHPARKYQNEGGPGIKDIAEVIWDYSGNALHDIKRLADALLFNYLISGSDAHAKNFSLIHSYGYCALAPFYDIASTLPYPGISQHKVKMAMKVGSEYKLKKIELRHWETCEKELRLPKNYLFSRLKSLLEDIPQAATSTAKLLHSEGLDHAIIDQLESSISERAKELQFTFF